MALRQLITVIVTSTLIGCGPSADHSNFESDSSPSGDEAGCPVKVHDKCDLVNAEMCGAMKLRCCANPSGEKTWEQTEVCPESSPPAPSSDTGTVVDSGTSSPSDTGTAPVADTGSPDTSPVVTDTGTVVADSGSTDTGSADTASTDSGSKDSGTVTDSGSSDTGAIDSGSPVVDSGPPPVTTGKLVVNIRLSRWGSHEITMMGMEVPLRIGGPIWGSSTLTTTGNGISATYDIKSGSEFEFNGYYDGTTSGAWTNGFTDYKSGALKVAVWASFDGKPTARAKTRLNSSGTGYNIVIVAAPSPLISSTDLDGDGFSPTDPDPLKRDCNDTSAGGQAFFPGQIEAPEDSMDFDCNGFVDPPRYVVQLKGPSSGYILSLVDAMKWPASTSMYWDAASASYRSSAFEIENLPREFYTYWGSGPSYDSILSWPSGSCVELTSGVQIFRDTDKTLVPVTLKVSSGSGTCHRFVDP